MAVKLIVGNSEGENMSEEIIDVTAKKTGYNVTISGIYHKDIADDVAKIQTRMLQAVLSEFKVTCARKVPMSNEERELYTELKEKLNWKNKTMKRVILVQDIVSKRPHNKLFRTEYTTQFDTTCSAALKLMLG